jgi:pimeloyl-ACP methyl ester carboxylesterase
MVQMPHQVQPSIRSWQAGRHKGPPPKLLLFMKLQVASPSSLPPPAPTAAAARLAPLPAATAAARSGPVPALHCYHGFGSNTWSWSLVQKPLADRLQALVTSHDMPGFGLTQRCDLLLGHVAGGKYATAIL